MNKLIIILLFLLSHLSFSQENSALKDYKIIIEKLGDLDKDGIDEKVIVYETSDSTEYGNVREIQVLKQTAGKWMEWRKSRNAILKSGEGGMMGEPFEGVEIKKGILLIYFYGGSSWKWAHTDKYRFQNNEFELIGYTSNYGKNCDYWENFDFNLSSGKIIVTKEYEDCNKNQEIYKTENESFFKKGVKINLSNRNMIELKITSPKYKHNLYL